MITMPTIKYPVLDKYIHMYSVGEVVESKDYDSFCECETIKKTTSELIAMADNHCDMPALISEMLSAVDLFADLTGWDKRRTLSEHLDAMAWSRNEEKTKPEPYGWVRIDEMMKHIEYETSAIRGQVENDAILQSRAIEKTAETQQRRLVELQTAVAVEQLRRWGVKFDDGSRRREPDTEGERATSAGAKVDMGYPVAGLSNSEEGSE